MNDIFDQACEYAAEIGISDDQIEDIVANAELCCEGPNGEGVCAENTRHIIDAAAKQFNNIGTSL